MHHPADSIAQTPAFVITVVEHWLEGDVYEGKGSKSCGRTSVHLVDERTVLYSIFSLSVIHMI